VSLEKNSLLRDRYRIQKQLAQSGMGAIYLAHDEVLNVNIAIKENLYTTEEHSQQFRQEATILAKLRHPNLPRVIDHFVLQGEGEYLVMDYIEGQNLQEVIEKQGKPLPEEEVVRIGVVICEALKYLHSRRPPIIHRDIKPGNIKTTREGQIILVDFGLAKHYQQDEMTAVGAKGTTAGYSPVEQYGHGTDARSDIYALGATLYTLITGQVPPEALDRALENNNLRPISEFNPEVSESLQQAIEKAMAVQADDRFQNAKAFQEALLAAYPLPDFSARESTVLPQTGSAGATPQQGVYEPTVRTPPKKKGKRVWAWLIPVLILVIGGGIGTYFVINGHIFGQAVVPSPSATMEAAAGITEGPTITQAPPTATVEEILAVESPTATMTVLPEGTPQGGGRGQVAFTSDRSGTPQVYLMNIDGTGIEQLTHEAEGACQPEWSPDGTRLAFISPCDGRKDQYPGASIFILNLETGRVDLISTLATGDFDPAWSPDGTRLAFTSLQTGKPQVFIYEFATGTAHLLMNRSISSRMPAWSPNGTQIAFISPSPVTNLPILMVVDAEGQDEPRGVLGQNYQEAYHPVWSPEGDLILFDLGDESSLGGRLLSRNQDTPIQTNLTSVENPEFSMDADWLVCDGVPEANGYDIFLMMRTGAHLARLTDDPADDYQPAWRP
jgi:hypothetical protein